MTIKKKLGIFITVATLVRMLVAMTTNLGNDEAYYLTYAQHLQWNYFDHPPMVALLIRLTTFDLTFTNSFFVRLGPIMLAAINTYIIFKIVTKLKNETAGFWAIILFTASIYTSLIAGVFIMPDAPQLFFWILCVYFLLEIIDDNANSKSRNRNLVWFAICSGLCIMSKIHGVFLWFGFGLYVLFYNRKMLSNGYLYLSVILTAAIASPILFWNINNDFITYSFHSQRVTINEGLNFSAFLRELVGGILYNNLFNYALIIFTLLAVFKNKISIALHQKRLLLLLGLPLILILLFISLFRDTLPHWSGPGYLALIILAAIYAAENLKKAKLALYGLYLIGFVVVAGIPLINLYPGTLGDKKLETFGAGDFTLDLYGWNQMKTDFEKMRQSDLQSNNTKTSFIISNKWFPGGHIDNYIAQPLHLDFVAIGKLEDIHTYYWLNNFRKKIQKGDDAYFIVTSNNFSDPNVDYVNLFEIIEKPRIINQYRSGKVCRKMIVFLMRNFKG